MKRDASLPHSLRLVGRIRSEHNRRHAKRYRTPLKLTDSFHRSAERPAYSRPVALPTGRVEVRSMNTASGLAAIPNRRFRNPMKHSAWVPDFSSIIWRSVVFPGFVNHSREVVIGLPVEQKSGLGIVEPGRVIRRTDIHARQTACSRQMFCNFSIIHRFVHADVEGLLSRLGMIDGRK